MHCNEAYEGGIKRKSSVKLEHRCNHSRRRHHLISMHLVHRLIDSSASIQIAILCEWAHICWKTCNKDKKNSAQDISNSNLSSRPTERVLVPINEWFVHFSTLPLRAIFSVAHFSIKIDPMQLDSFYFFSIRKMQFKRWDGKKLHALFQYDVFLWISDWFDYGLSRTTLYNWIWSGF